MTTIIPGTINGVEQTSTFLSRLSEHTVVVNTTASVVTEPVLVRAVCVAPIVKKVPVNFFATTTYEGTTSTRFIGSATFVDSAATLETRAIGTGTSVIRAQWPGEGRWRGFDFTTPGSVFLAPGFPFTGTVSITSNNNPVYQLNTGTITASLSTGTTATGAFVFKEGSLTLATVPITSGKSVTWTFDPNILSTATTSHNIVAEWTGGRLDTIPFYGKDSSPVVQVVNTATLALGLSSQLITIADPLTITATLNTSSINTSRLVSFYNNQNVSNDPTQIVLTTESGGPGLTKDYVRMAGTQPATIGDKFRLYTTNINNLTNTEFTITAISYSTGSTRFDFVPAFDPAIESIEPSTSLSIRYTKRKVLVNTATIVNNSSSIIIPGLSSGTYFITGEISGTSPFIESSSTQLIVTNRANWPGTFTLSGATSAYQLANQTFTFTTNLNTTTSGSIFLQEVSGNQTRNISTATFNTSTITFVVNPNNYAFTATNTHNFRIFWEGQSWTPGVRYPYNATFSNTLTQTATAVISLFANGTKAPLTLSTSQNISLVSIAGTSSYSAITSTTVSTIPGSVEYRAYTQVLTLEQAFTTTNTSLVIASSLNKTRTDYNISAGSTIGTQWFPTTYVNSEPTGIRSRLITYSGGTVNWIDGQDKGVVAYVEQPAYLYQNWPLAFRQGDDNIQQYWLKVNDVRGITTQTGILIDATVSPSAISYGPGVTSVPDPYTIFASSQGSPNLSNQPFPNGVEVRLTNAPYRVTSVQTFNNEKYLVLRQFLVDDDSIDDLRPYAYPPFDSNRRFWGVDGGYYGNDLLGAILHRNNIDPTRLNLRIRVFNINPGTANDVIRSQSYIENNIEKPLVNVLTTNGISSATVQVNELNVLNTSTQVWNIRANWIGSKPVVTSNSSTITVNQ